MDAIGNSASRRPPRACVEREPAVGHNVVRPTRPRRRRCLDRKVRVAFSYVVLGEDLDLDRLRQKIRVPYQALQSSVARLQRIQQANDALRRTGRFSVLAKRLEVQMSELGGGANGSGAEDNQEDKERAIAKAALSIAELSMCLCVWCG